MAGLPEEVVSDRGLVCSVVDGGLCLGVSAQILAMTQSCLLLMQQSVKGSACLCARRALGVTASPTASDGKT